MSKFYMQVSAFTGTPEMTDGSLKFVVEWKRLAGARQGGKVMLTIPSVDRDLANDLRDALAAHLSGLFAPEVIRTRDIVLLG